MATVTHERARVANAIRHNHDPELIAEARGDLTVAWIERKLAEAGPLSAGQVATLRALLPAPSAGAGDAP